MREMSTPRILTQAERLNAIAWKAKQCGMSYGTFQVALTKSDYMDIYDEYADYLTAKETEEKERLTAAATTHRLGKSARLENKEKD